MSNVISLTGFRDRESKPKQKRREQIYLPFAPFKDAGGGCAVRKEITDLLQKAEELKKDSYLLSLPTYHQREKAVVDSLNLVDKAHTLASTIGCKIVRLNKEKEVVYEIRNKD